MKKRKKKKPLPTVLKDTQKIFNKWIRHRDRFKGCISCTYGKVQQAGHFIAQGSSSNLRFDPDNVNGQCISCNKFKGGNLIEYRISLIRKIGEERVKWLEENRKVVKRWTRLELEELQEKYKLKESQND